MLPAPSRVLAQIAANRGLLWTNTLQTLKATGAGFALSLSVAAGSTCRVTFQLVDGKVTRIGYSAESALPAVG